MLFFVGCMIENDLSKFTPIESSGDETEVDVQPLQEEEYIEEEEEQEYENITETSTYGNNCDVGEVVVERIQVEFPATQGCLWNEEGNLPMMEGHFQARMEQELSFDFDSSFELCDVEFGFSSEVGGIDFPFHYDDHVLFTMNDRIVFHSFSPLNMQFAKDEFGYFLYDWNDIRGHYMGFYVDAYGIGNHISLDLPNHDQLGSAFLSVDGEALSNLSNEVLQEERLDFQFVSFGDNDAGDCEHSGFSFWIDVYMEER